MGGGDRGLLVQQILQESWQFAFPDYWVFEFHYDVNCNTIKMGHQERIDFRSMQGPGRALLHTVYCRCFEGPTSWAAKNILMETILRVAHALLTKSRHFLESLRDLVILMWLRARGPLPEPT